ncbi:hypothetical protein [Nesterenkonia sedimenti]|nr:hypothetical protein [Nesterenkonia sedimenti]
MAAEIPEEKILTVPDAAAWRLWLETHEDTHDLLKVKRAEVLGTG